MVCLVLDCFFVVCDVLFDVFFYTLGKFVRSYTTLTHTISQKRPHILTRFDIFNVVANVLSL